MAEMNEDEDRNGKWKKDLSFTDKRKSLFFLSSSFFLVWSARHRQKSRKKTLRNR